MGCRRRQDSALAVAWTAWAPRGIGVERVPRAFLADGDGDVGRNGYHGALQLVRDPVDVC